MNNCEYDVIVLGSGPGGYIAAIRASQLGLKTAIIEKENLGGICLNWGCIPTKSLLHTTEILHSMKHSHELGIQYTGVSIDINKIVSRSREVSSKLSDGIKYLLSKNKISILKGHGRFVNKNCIEVSQCNNSIKVTGKNIIIATGARAKFLKGLSPQDSDIIMGYRQALTPNTIPKKLLIIGSGAIGIEFASFYHALGTDVTIVEIANRILMNEDEEISKFAEESFRQQGIKILTCATIQNFVTKEKQIHFSIKTKSTEINASFDAVISAIGVTANIEDIGLEKTKVTISDKGHIMTDQYMQTNEEQIFAIGDVVAPPWVAHKASHEGVLVAEFIAGNHPQIINHLNIPACTYSYPQIASVGLTQTKAENEYGKHGIKVGNFPLNANSKAVILNHTKGFIKTIFHHKTGELLGAHMIGAEVTELIYGLVLSKQLEATEIDLMNIIFPHPTISEAIHESVLNAYDKSIHI